MIHCQSKWSCTRRNRQNKNSITTGVASDMSDSRIGDVFAASPFTNYKIPIITWPNPLLVNQFLRCLFVHNGIHKISESSKLRNGNDFLTAQATPRSSTARFSCWASSRQIAHRSGTSLRLARNRRVLPQPKKRGKYKPGLSLTTSTECYWIITVVLNI